MNTPATIENRTYTIWGNGGKFEWLIRDGERISARSGSIFNSYGAAKRAMVKALSQPDAFND
jgi:hypothetical protein